MSNKLLTRFLLNFRSWIIGALVWLMLSLVVSVEHIRSGQPSFLHELGGLLSIVWLQFGFAGLFNTLRREQGRRAIGFVLIAIIPPLLLYCINTMLLWYS